MCDDIHTGPGAWLRNFNDKRSRELQQDDALPFDALDDAEDSDAPVAGPEFDFDDAE